jgi:hypothetical protein
VAGVVSLRQWVDRKQGLVGACPLPVVHQLFLVAGCPLDDHPEGSRWQVPTEDLSCLYVYLGLVFAVDGVEMGWVVIVKVHLNDDAVEA